MAEQVKNTKKAGASAPNAPASSIPKHVTPDEAKAEVTEALLDEIDDLLAEEDAATFVREFRQAGGQ